MGDSSPAIDAGDDTVCQTLVGLYGNVDQRVPVTHAERYRKELDKYNKNYKYVELEGADHFSNTLFYHHQIELFTSMIDYLENDCGNMSLRAGNDTASGDVDMAVANQGSN